VFKKFSGNGNLIFVIVLCAILTLLPQLIKNIYEIGLLTDFAITLILLIGLNIISGYGGQLSLGQVTFYGLGAYVAVLQTSKLHIPTGFGLIIAPLICAIFAAIIGIPSLRLRGLYFAMSTLGVSVVFTEFVANSPRISGGENGLTVTNQLQIFGHMFFDPKSIYYLCVFFVFISYLITYFYIRSRWGWSLRAAEASEPSAAVVGINIFYIRLGAFMLSGAIAGLAGSLEAYHQLYITPEGFSFAYSILLFVALTIGGLGTASGPVIGAFILYAFKRWFGPFVAFEPLAVGLTFILCLRYFPRGIDPVIRNFFSSLTVRIKNRKSKSSSPTSLESAK
jgi:branched-chain amino acid transport system permease protein